MKKIFTIIFSLLIVVGCKPKGSMYVYKETGTQKIECDTIFLESDSVAYIAAFTSFMISKKAFNETVKILGDVVRKHRNELNEPMYFGVFRENGTEIFPDEFDISDTLLAIEKRIIERKSFKNANVKYDSSKVNELIKFFDVEKDKFSPEGLCWYTPKDKPASLLENAVYCYIAKTNDEKPNLRFVIQYTSKNWLFIDKIYFSIGEKAYRYIPDKVNRDNGSGFIWEWTDESVNAQSKEIINALTKHDMVEMKLDGRQYYSVKKIPAKQIQSIKRTVELYKAMGGEM